MKIVIVFGTRPEAIKLCPLIVALKESPVFDCKVCVTGQHREMLQQVLDVFNVKPDVDFALMRPNQTLGELTSRALVALDGYFASEKPDVVVVQGDTTTVLAGALAAFYHHIPIAHVEAGLRTGNLQSPWPEEANRVLTTRLAKWHFAPTESNRRNLLREGVADSSIYVVGNTVIDALHMARRMGEKQRVPIDGLSDDVMHSIGRMILITGHRRENFGTGFENICRAIRNLAKEFSDVHFVYPVHLNPNVREPVRRILSGSGLQNVHLIPPQEYLPFVSLLNRAHIVLTDSGGVQEEAPGLGKPVLVMRDTTERPEAVDAGTVKLVGTDQMAIEAGVRELLESQSAYEAMSVAINPYGDGHAVKRIVDILANGQGR